MALEFKKLWDSFLKKLQFWKSSEDILNQGTFDSVFNSIFSSKESEKKKILDILNKKKINTLLFYTDVRNLEHIINFGLEPLNKMIIRENENYYVWSYLQKEDSINLEFELSTRAHFWKWSNSVDFDTRNLAVIGISPMQLFRLTKDDWFFDKSLNLVSITEVVQPEAIEWVMVRKKESYLKIKEMMKNNSMKIDVYLTNEE